jgi:thiamine pyrophosphate-dependent acetolactate synthase large subunit-like protein
MGMSGLLGYGAYYEANHQADLLLLLGTDFPYDEFLPQARTMVDHDAPVSPGAPHWTSRSTATSPQRCARCYF